MQMQKVACMTAAGFLGILLVASAATPAFSQSRGVVVEAPRSGSLLERSMCSGGRSASLRGQTGEADAA